MPLMLNLGHLLISKAFSKNNLGSVLIKWNVTLSPPSPFRLWLPTKLEYLLLFAVLRNIESLLGKFGIQLAVQMVIQPPKKGAVGL